MAKIKKCSNTIKKNIALKITNIIMTILMYSIYIYALNIKQIPQYYMFIPLPLIIVFIKKQLVKVSQLKSGLEGEAEVLKLLKKLPKDFYILSNKKISINDTELEFDYIVITSGGITVIEVKNYVGTLIGNINDNYLIQKKQVKGKKISKTIKNPIKQINRQEKALKRILKSYNISIRSIVYFNNQKTTFNLIGWDNRIINNKKELINNIKKNNVANLSKKETKNLIKYLVNNYNYQ